MVAQLSEEQQRSIDNELWEYAEVGNLEKVKQALQKGANFKCHFKIRYSEGRYVTRTTPHTVAYINGHNTIVQLLENAGATPDYDEIMLAAAVRGLVDIVKEALKKNANVNAKEQDFDDDTALHIASGNGHTETVQFLLQSKVDPNIYNKWGHSPLHIAYWYGHDNIVKLLCSFGGDMDQVRNDDLLLTSAENGNIENVTQALTSGANVNVHHPKKDQKTALHLASKGGYCDIVQLLLNSNANPNICGWYQQTSLQLASEGGYCDIVQLLLNSNADPNIFNEVRETALHVASEGGYCDIVQLLLNSNADPNICDRYQQTALYVASERGYCDIVQLLLNSNADPNIFNENHQTALHVASKGGYCDIVQLLLNSNADPNIFNENHQTALHVASKGGYCDIVQLLLNSNVDPNICDKDHKTALHVASERGYCDMVKLLLNSNANPNICDSWKRTPAHFAAQKGHVDVLKLLIEVGHANINATDKDGNNLLHLACASGDEETIHYLLHNVQLNPDYLAALNSNQQMPLDCIPASNANRFQLLKLFQPFKQCHRDYLTESYDLCGKTETGKSSLTAGISYRANKSSFHDCDPINIGINESVSESITEDNNTVSGKFNASKIFRVHSADLCDIIVDANPHRIVNRLVAANLLPQDIAGDVRSTTDVYDKADKIVGKLQRQIDDDEHSIELLKKICDFLLEQTDKTLKDIGTKMMSQL